MGMPRVKATQEVVQVTRERGRYLLQLACGHTVTRASKTPPARASCVFCRITEPTRGR